MVLASYYGAVYFYIVHRVNNSGCQEHTISAAVRVAINANGDLAQPQPNNIFEARAEQADGDKVQLVWYYCPLAQKQEPRCFKVYYDAGTGQIDYQNPIASINYVGRAFYSYQSDALNADSYLFTIRSEGADGTEDTSFAQLMIQFGSTSPDVIEVVCIEVI